MRGTRERAVAVAVFDDVLGDEIVGTIETRARRTRCETRDRIGDGGKRIGVDLDQAQRIFRDRAAFGDHNANRLAHVSELVARERIRIDLEPDRGRRHRERNAVARQMRTEIVIGEHRADSCERSRRGDVHALQPRMRMRAAEERRVQELGQPDVVDEPAASAQQRLILDALDALTQERG